MKILFVIPPYPYLDKPSSQMPLGILYVVSFFKKNMSRLFDNIDVINLAEYSVDKAKEELGKTQYDWYAFTMTTMDYSNVCDIISYIPYKRNIVLGGVHPTIDYFNLINSNICDRVFVGDIEGVRYDVNRFFPDRNSVEGKTLFNGTIFSAPVNENPVSSSIITSRGCSMNCAFCVSGALKSKAKFRNAESVEIEIKELVDLGVNEVRVQDDNLFVSPYFYDIVDIFRRNNIKWRASARINNVDRNKLNAAYQAGCREIGYGIESADDRVLKKLRKNISIQDAYHKIRLTKDAGINVRLFFMINTPGENENTADKNIEFISKTQASMVTNTIFNAFPGTDIYLNPQKYGIKKTVRNPSDFCICYDKNNLYDETIYTSFYEIDDEVQLKNRFKMIDFLVGKGLANLG